MLQNTPTELSSLSAQRSYGAGRLTVKSSKGESRIDKLFQEGCARIRIPKSHDNDHLEAVMINTSGGMTGGDRLNWEFEVGENAGAIVTTQACERIYKSTGGAAKTEIKLKLAKGARLAWLPQETILFDQSKFHREITIEMERSSSLLFLESLVFGRTTMGETVEHGAVKDRWQFSCEGKIFHADFLAVDGAINSQLNQTAIANGNVAMASLVLVSNHSETKLKQARNLIGDMGGASYWETAKTGKLLARVIAKDSYHLRKTLLPLIDLLNDGARLPKCWAL